MKAISSQEVRVHQVHKHAGVVACMFMLKMRFCVISL